MLVLTRSVGDKVTIGRNIEVTVVKIDGNKVRIGIKAPNNIPILREEIVCSSPKYKEISCDNPGSS